MAKIIQKISLEVAKPNFLQAIIAKQFDSDSRYLRVTLVNGSEKIEVQATSTVTINARRNDGAEDAFKGEVNEDGTVTVPLTYWMLELDGKLECDITVIDTDNSKLSSTKFTIEVERASCSGEGTDSADKYDIIILQGKDIVASVNGKKGEVEITAADLGIGDYVMEQGIKDGWHYRKWASGTLDCWTKWACWRTDAYMMMCQPPDLPYSITDENIQATIVMDNEHENSTADRNVKAFMSQVEGKENISLYVMVYSNTIWAENAELKLYISVKGTWK